MKYNVQLIHSEIKYVNSALFEVSFAEFLTFFFPFVIFFSFFKKAMLNAKNRPLVWVGWGNERLNTLCCKHGNYIWAGFV